MKKAAIFDLDGTLLNTLDSIAYCGNTALAKFGMKTLDTDLFPAFVGNGAKALVERMFEYAGGDKSVFDDFKAFFLRFYDDNGVNKTYPYPGINELINELRARNIKTAVLSNKPHSIVYSACEHFFPDKFDVVYGQRDGFAQKPDPAILFDVISELGCTADECLYCGDSNIDVMTGLNAKVTMLGAAWGFYGDRPFDNANGVLRTPLDMLYYLRG